MKTILGYVPEIIEQIFVGLIIVGVFEAGRWCVDFFRKRRFKSVFGKDVLKSGTFHLVYAQLALPQLHDDQGNVVTHPYVKSLIDSSTWSFSIERPVSSCEVRAAKYLAEVIGRETKSHPSLTSDLEINGRHDVSFVALGGPQSNYQTRIAINSDSNHLLAFDNIHFTSVGSGRPVLLPRPEFDYGFILKVIPQNFPDRVWFVCAGLGEWGTSGAAFYLARRWNELFKLFGISPFALIVRVARGQDESAESVLHVREQREAERIADNISDEQSSPADGW
jgi:hypothetical protein